MPLGYLIKQTFKQPIFGSNYIKAYCKSFTNGTEEQIIFKIWFTHGGSGTFVPAFINLVNNIKKNANAGPDSNFIESLETGAYKKNAYIDPNDPTVILIEANTVNFIFILECKSDS